MKVFVSGEQGLIAHALCERLKADGHVLLNDALPKTWKTQLNLAPEVNVLDPAVLEQLQALKSELIVHASALAGTEKCEASEQDAWEQNVNATYNLARLWKPGVRFVYFSTTAIYDPEAPRPLTTMSSVKPFTIYGRTKHVGELVMKARMPLQDLLVLRPTFAYGGVRDHSSVLRKIIDDALCQGPGVDVLLDPSNRKDFMHVSDLVGVVQGLISAGAHGTLNVARGKPRPYRDAVMILEQLGLKPNIRWHPEADYLGDHVVSGQLAVGMSGFAPRVSLEEGIALAVEELRGEQR